MAAQQDTAVAASAKGATFLILLQIGSRALTFALNQVLLRFLSPELIGAALQLEIFIITAHHFARESLRVACQRQTHGGLQAPINLSYLAIGGGVAIVAGLGEWYIYTGQPQVPYFVPALRICEVAAVLELLSEPAFVVVQQKMLYKVRASAEASAVVFKTLATTAAVFWSQRRSLDLGVLPFAAGELAYCATLMVVYLWRTSSAARSGGGSLLLSRLPVRTAKDFYLGYFSKPLLNLSLSLYVQSGIKYLLTQGDTLVSARFATLEDQGMYALSANYGGLIARMLLRPIEDSSRNLFASLCHDSQTDKAKVVKDVQDKTRTKPSSSIQEAASILQSILRFYGIVSLLAVAIGPTAAPLLLRIVAGARWSDSGAGEVLSIYCYCIPLLAINGVSEAFVAAAASSQELQRQSFWMGAFSVGFAASTWVFLSVLHMGAKGLVLANCVNMGLRILFNLEFATRYFQSNHADFQISAILPGPSAIAAAAVFASLVRATTGALYRFGVLGELARIGGLGFLLALLLAWSERRFLITSFRKFKPENR